MLRLIHSVQSLLNSDSVDSSDRTFVTLFKRFIDFDVSFRKSLKNRHFIPLYHHKFSFKCNGQ